MAKKKATKKATKKVLTPKADLTNKSSLAPLPKTQAIAKTNHGTDIQNLLNSVLAPTDMTGTQQAEKAAADFHGKKVEGLNELATLITGAAALSDLLKNRKATVQKYRDMFKINSRKSLEVKDRSKWSELGILTYGDFGIVFDPPITYTNNGKEYTVTAESPIGWTNFCHAICKRPPQSVNVSIGEGAKVLGAAFAPEPEAGHPSPIPKGLDKPANAPSEGDGNMVETQLGIDPAGNVYVKDNATPAPAKPIKPMMEVPDLRTGDIDSLIDFLNADSVIGAVPPMDAVFGELNAFDLGKKVEQLGQRIIDQNLTDDYTYTIKVTTKKKQKRGEPKVPIDPKAKTLADVLAAEVV